MRARFILPGILLLACTFSSADAQTRAVKIGVLNDQSGVYADDQGIGSMIAAQLAVEDFPSKSGTPVEVTTADHQNARVPSHRCT
jgi:branched-chain amino acid transport system substrate-binding protein